MADEQKAPSAAAAEPQEELTAQQFLDESDRFMALKQWEKAADGYAQALELLQQDVEAEQAPELAPVLHRYGKCLLEYAIATSGALGGGGNKEAPMPKKPKQPKASGSSSSSKPAADPRFHFSGDAEDDDDDEDAEEEEGPAAGDEEDDEDDLSVAFSILDLTRVIYQKIIRTAQDQSPQPDTALETLSGDKWSLVKVKSELAEVLNDLGDVGLESENFQQAASDLEESLSILSPLLHPHSRRLADAYLRLGVALEFHPDSAKQSSTRQYIESAFNALKQRFEAVQTRRKTITQLGDEEARKQSAAAIAREEKVLEEDSEAVDAAAAATADTKGKGPGNAHAQPEALQLQFDDVAEMDSIKLDREAKDLTEIISELEAKLQDISEAPAKNQAGSSSSSSVAGLSAEDAKAALQQALNDAFLGSSTNAPVTSAPAPSGPVNDLSSMVRKKKKRPAEEQETAEEEVQAKGKGKALESTSAAAAATTTATNGESATAQSSSDSSSKKTRVG